MYLNQFPYDKKLVDIEIVVGCGNTISVVEKGLELKEAAQNKKRPFIHVYCVIDRDDHPDNRYRQAFAESYKHNNVSVIWANEAFELWYLLHYDYLDTRTHRNDLSKRFAAKLGRPYEKSDDTIFKDLESRIDTAFQNAERLERECSEEKEPYMNNPSTNIHDLVAKLLEIGKLNNDAWHCENLPVF